MGTYDVDTEHLLLGLLRQKQGSAAQLLQRIGVSVESVERTVRQQGLRRQNELQVATGKVWPPPPRAEGYPEQEPPGGTPPVPSEVKGTQEMKLTRPSKHVIDFAYDEARKLNEGNILPEHLLLGMIREGKGIAGQVLAESGVNLDRARQVVTELQSRRKSEAAGGWLKSLFGRKESPAG